jgi:polyphosphate kinase
MKKKLHLYFNRELSWLEFNQHVLDEALDPSVPLLERLKFLAISASNLDEFFMVRVGSLQWLVNQHRVPRDPSGMTCRQQLRAIGQRARKIINDQYACLINELEPALLEAGIRRLASDQLTPTQAGAIEQIFENEIFPVLTPMSVGESSNFPLLVNQALNLCVRLTVPTDTEDRFAVIPFLGPLQRFLTLQSEDAYFYTLLEDVVGLHINRFFPGESVQEVIPFRISRNADLRLDDSAGDLLAGMEDILNARTESPCVRLEIADSASGEMLKFLQQSLQITNQETYTAIGPLDLSAFFQLAGLSGFEELNDEPWPSQVTPEIDPTLPMFEILSKEDILLHHPYESYEPVVRFIEEAAADPDVLAIKQILYRTSRKSPIIAALRMAAEKGKNVTVLVELKARFDEARNIEWAKSLEQNGVQVIYGVKGLKTHAKICIIVRREPHGIQRYLHIGTGNYNEATARLYADISFMTANEELGADATDFFNAISGYSQFQHFRKIEAAPIGLRERLLELIEIETRRKKQGQKAVFRAKLNSLVDPEIIQALYDASNAGVKIQLNIRGICCLRPGVPELSENISVISIVDRFLEHSRILYFYHGGDERVFISSADWMPRNLDRRVELLVPVESPRCKKRLISLLDTFFKDTVKARRLMPEGTYERVKPKGRRKKMRSQEMLYQQTVEIAKQAVLNRVAVFEPHRAAGSEF